MYCMRRYSSHDYWIILCIAHWNCISVSVHVIFYFEVLLAFMFIFENESRISLSSHNTGQTNHPVSFLFKKTITSYPASRGYIFAVWAVLRKVASADNHSILYRACEKFVTRFASKNRKKNPFFNLFIQISGRIWTVVGRGYFSHASSHSKNVPSARRVIISWILDAWKEQTRV